MADGFIADGGTWKQLSGVFLADGGTWKETDDVLLADGGTWKTAHESGPDVTATVALASDAPWSRVTYNISATGTWENLQVNLIRHYTADRSGSSVSSVLHEWGQATSDTTVSVDTETDKLDPVVPYDIEVRWLHADGWYRVSSLTEVTTAAWPGMVNQRVFNPITDTSGGVEWDFKRDVEQWRTNNITSGTTHDHPGDLPYAWWSGTLSPDTTYTVRTRPQINGIWGPWSGNAEFTTTAQTYTPGDIYISSYRTETYDNYGWSNSRSYQYHAYYSSNRGVQRACAFFGHLNPQMVVLRNALAAGATITGAWATLGRPTEGIGSWGSVNTVVSRFSSAYPNAPSAIGGNYVSTALPADGNRYGVPVPVDWITYLVNQGDNNHGLMWGNTSSSAYYMALLKSDFSRLQVRIA